jgi:hypothetical protein
LLWLLTQQVIKGYDQSATEFTFIDRSSPARLRYGFLPEQEPRLRAGLQLECASFE